MAIPRIRRKILKDEQENEAGSADTISKMIKDMNFWIQEAQYIANSKIKIKTRNLDLNHHWKTVNAAHNGIRPSFSSKIRSKTRKLTLTIAIQHYTDNL